MKKDRFCMLSVPVILLLVLILCLVAATVLAAETNDNEIIGVITSGSELESSPGHFGVITAHNQDAGGTYYLVNGSKIYSPPINVTLPAVIWYTQTDNGIVLQKVLVEFNAAADGINVNSIALSALNTAYVDGDVAYYYVLGELTNIHLINKTLTIDGTKILLAGTYLYDFIKAEGGLASDPANDLLFRLPKERFGGQTLALVDKSGYALLIAFCGDLTTVTENKTPPGDNKPPATSSGNNDSTNPQLTVTAGDTKLEDTKLKEPEVPLAQPISFAPFIQGFEDNTFRGTSVITREQFVTILFRLKGAQSAPPAKKSYYSFMDVAPDRWSYDAIKWAQKAGIIDADDDGNFRPAEPLTRAGMAVMLVKADNLKVLAEDTFNDLAEHPDKDDILKAVQAKIFTGYPDGTFRPNGQSIRAEAVTALIRYLLGQEPSSEMWQNITLPFSDVYRQYWAYKYIALAVNGM